MSFIYCSEINEDVIHAQYILVNTEIYFNYNQYSNQENKIIILRQ